MMISTTSYMKDTISRPRSYNLWNFIFHRAGADKMLKFIISSKREFSCTIKLEPYLFIYNVHIWNRII